MSPLGATGNERMDSTHYGFRGMLSTLVKVIPPCEVIQIGRANALNSTWRKLQQVIVDKGRPSADPDYSKISSHR